MKKIDDNFFEDCFKNSFKTMDLDNNEFDYDLCLLEFNPEKREKVLGSSGSLSYSLIRILYEMILDEKFEINDKFTLVIDEIEKFLHPELIFRISNMIVKVSEKIKVVVTTHSPIFLERIFYLHKNKIKNNLGHDIGYCIKHEKYGDEIFRIDKEKINDVLRNNNYRVISNLSYFLFSSKCFFIEGLVDNTIINDIIDNLKIDKPYSIVDCGSKSGIKSMYELVKELSLIQFYDICLFYDIDDDKNDDETFVINENHVFKIMNNPNIEESLFCVKKNGKKKCIITKNKKISMENFKKEDGFIFSIEWIKNNSIKDDVDRKINDLINEIRKFMSK